MNITNLNWECVTCGKPVYDYIPQYCCNGYMCGCHGEPIYPPICSDICDEALRDHNIKIPRYENLINWLCTSNVKLDA